MANEDNETFDAPPIIRGSDISALLYASTYRSIVIAAVVRVLCMCGVLTTLGERVVGDPTSQYYRKVDGILQALGR